MENEIEVGDWVRTDNGIIGKYVKYRGIEDAIETNNKWIGFDIEKDIVKHSPNLIDLIQCGDYVNGEKVEKIAEPSLANDYNRLIYCNECEGLYKLILFNKDIKEIVTKEMMESISYKVTKM